MKFSFDSEGYRNNLASELREERATDKEGARKRLEEERATLQYKVSADIKKVLEQIETKKQGNEQQVQEPVELKDIGVETLKMIGSDGMERELEVRTLDVVDQMPDSLKLSIDLYRLWVIDTKLSDLGIHTNRDALSEYLHPGHKISWGHSVFTQYFFESNLLEIPKDQLTKEQEEKLAQAIKTAKEKANEFAKQRRREYKDFLKKITNNAFEDDGHFIHVVGADDFSNYGNPDVIEHLKKRLDQRFPHADENEVIMEQPLNIQQSASDELWFDVGKSYWLSEVKPILLGDTKSERFRNEVAVAPEVLEEILASKRDNNYVEFKRNVPWFYICDWIIDPYHGRAYKITEK